MKTLYSIPAVLTRAPAAGLGSGNLGWLYMSSCIAIKNVPSLLILMTRSIGYRYSHITVALEIVCHWIPYPFLCGPESGPYS